MPTLDVRLEEFREAAGALLDSVVVAPRANGEAYARIRRQTQRLNAWFAKHTGWRVEEHPEFVRLVKPAVWAPCHAPEWAADRRDYELFAWILWYGEQAAGRRFTLSILAEEIRSQSGKEDPDQAFDWKKLQERRRLVRMLQQMETLGVIRVRDGSFQEWQDEVGKLDALCEWGAIGWSLHLTLPSASLERLAQGESLRCVATPQAQPAPLVRAYRQLLLTPALFRRDDPQAFDAVTSDPEVRRQIAVNLLDHTGWEMEATTSYVRLLRTGGRAETERMPLRTDSSESHVILLLCGALREAAGRGDLQSAGGDHFVVLLDDLELLMMPLRERFSENWRKDLRSFTGTKLLDLVLPRMLRCGLLRPSEEENRYLVSPLCARLQGFYVTDEETEDEE